MRHHFPDFRISQCHHCKISPAGDHIPGPQNHCNHRDDQRNAEDAFYDPAYSASLSLFIISSGPPSCISAVALPFIPPIRISIGRLLFHIRRLYPPFSAFFLNGFLIFTNMFFKKKLAPAYTGAVLVSHLIVSVVCKVQSVEDVEHKSHQHSYHTRQHHSRELDASELHSDT